MQENKGLYHFLAVLTVAIWGATFVSTKILINTGLSPNEIFLYRFLIAYAGIWIISHKRLFADNWKDEATLEGRTLGRYRLPGNQHIAFRHSRKGTSLYLDGHVAQENQFWLRLNSPYGYPMNRSATDVVRNLLPYFDTSRLPVADFSPF